MGIGNWLPELFKLDKAPVDGLLGVVDSIGYKLEEIETHFHNHEHWRGKLAVQTEINWADNTLTPYQAISGSNDYGSDADDEAKVLGTGDTPINGDVKFDPFRILIISLSTDTPWKLRMAHGSGTLSEAIAAEQVSEVMVVNVVTGSKSGGTPLEFRTPRLDAGVDKVWIQAWNATDNATCEFFIGLHGYAG